MSQPFLLFLLKSRTAKLLMNCLQSQTGEEKKRGVKVRVHWLRNGLRSSIATSILVIFIAMIGSKAQAQVLIGNEVSLQKEYILAQDTAQQAVLAEKGELRLDSSSEQAVKGGETHRYRITLETGQYLNVVVEQLGVNVEVSLSDPTGKQIASVDWWWREGTEALWALVEATGDYTLKVSASSQPIETGKYRIKIEKLGNWEQASTADRDYVTAYKNFAEGEKLHAQATAESLRKASEKYQEALRLWRGMKDSQGEAQALNGLGVIEYRAGNLKQAAEHLSQAIALFRRVQNRHGEADSLSTLSVVYNFSGEPQKALDHYNLALPLARASKDSLVEAQILSGLGLVLQRLGQTQKALEALNELILMSRARGIIDGEASGHNNLGLIYISQGRLREAIQEYSQTLVLLKRSEDRFGQAATLNNIGSAYARIGDFQQALDYLHQGLNLRRVIGDRRGEAANLGSIGYFYLRLGDYPKAIQYYDQSLALSQAIGSRDHEAIAFLNLGTIYGRMGELQKARDQGDRALALMTQLKDRTGEANVLTSLGSIHSQLGEQQKALDYYEKALMLRRAGEDQYGESYTLSALGTVHAQLGNQSKALENLNQALALSRGMSDRPGELSTLYQLARFERSRGNFTQARDNLQVALKIIESARAKVSLADVRAIYFASHQEIYTFYIDLLMQLYKSEKEPNYMAEALRVNEQRSARSLLDMLIESQTDIRTGIAPELLELERRLQQDLNAKADQQVRLLSRKHTAEQAAVLSREVDALTTDYEQAFAQIRQSSSTFAALTHPSPLNLKQMQTEVLDADTVLLEYALGNERSYLWAVTRTSLVSYELPGREAIENLARQAYELLTTRNRLVRFEEPDRRQIRIAKADAEYSKVARTLSQMLLGPVASQIRNKRLLIVSDGALQYLPFAALPAPGSTNLQSNSVPLIARHEIIGLPSASTLDVLRKQIAGRKPAPKMIAVLADPVFNKADERLKTTVSNVSAVEPALKTNPVQSRDEKPEGELTRSTRDLGLTDEEFRFKRLPFTRLEAEAIVAFAPVAHKKALDFSASETTAINPEMSQYRYLHFATHGLINSRHPELSGIVLSLVNPQGSDQDGFLMTREIYNLKLPAELVVLSGCRTGLGKQIKGEGLLGLTRGFMYAGAARVIVSLWDVNDESTARLMTQLYQTMLGKEQLSPAAALRAAQIRMWKSNRWKAPYYWAAFTLQGEYR